MALVDISRLQSGPDRTRQSGGATHGSAHPPPGRHWKIYALLGPVLVVSGIVLRFLHDAGTGNFLVVMGVTNLASYLYMRFRALDVVDAAAEIGRFIFPAGGV